MRPLLRPALRWHPFTRVERQARAATRNQPWGPTGTELNELADLTRNPVDAAIIFAVLELRLAYPANKWRNVYKAGGRVQGGAGAAFARFFSQAAAGALRSSGAGAPGEKQGRGERVHDGRRGPAARGAARRRSRCWSFW